MALEFGREKVDLWRKSFNDPPPFIDFEDKQHPRFDKVYADLSEEEYKEMPCGESLEMVRQRVESYWKREIFPKLESVEPGK